MSRLPGRAAAAVLLALTATAACGNSPDDGASPSPAGAGDEEAERITGEPGVSDDAITFAVVGTKAGNPLGTCILDCYVEGIEAYFAYRNAEGGVHGRDLVLGDVLDDEMGQNQVRALDVISGEQAFGVFEATLLATGWGDLDAAGIPTYTWGIHPTEAADRSHVFPSYVIRCSDCTSHVVPYAATRAGATRAASLGYGVSENSKVCADTMAESFELYAGDTGVEPAYTKDDLAYGLPNGIGPEVTAMKDAGVDFIAGCIDLNGMKTLAQELDRQGMDDVVLYHNNTYNHDFVAEAGDLFEGDLVSVLFRPFEAETEGTALVDFLDAMEAQGSEPTELAMVGWINATLAYEGLLAAGPEFDRAAVVEATNAMTDFSAGGLLAPIDWSQAHTPYTQDTRAEIDDPECGALVRVEDGEFTTVADPVTPWLCWDQGDLAWAEPEPTSFE